MRVQVELSVGEASRETVLTALRGLEVALQKGGEVLVLPVPPEFPMNQMPWVARSFVERLQEIRAAT